MTDQFMQHHVQDAAIQWAKTAQLPSYYYANCWSDRVAQFQNEFPSLSDSEKDITEMARAEPELTVLQVLASYLSSDGNESLQFAKRAFWKSGFDKEVQNTFLRACANFLGHHYQPETSLDFICSRPFETLEIGGSGTVTACCSGWLPTVVGYTETSSLESIWMSDEIKSIRSRIRSGDYSPCSQALCPYFHRDHSKPVPQRNLYEPRKYDHGCESSVPDFPRSLHLCYDSSCNLSCPSCRTSLVVAKNSDRIFLHDKMLPLVEAALPRLERIWITGSGDPFASKHFTAILGLLAQPRNRHIIIDLQTNGILFDEKAWTRFEFDGRLGVVIISIDAGTESTYRTTRRGGDFHRLMRNIAFIGDQRRRGQMQSLRLDSVIQNINFAEIPKMAEIADENGFDSAYLSIITNWGHLSFSEFNEAFVFSPDHAHFGKLRKIFDDHRSNPKLDWGNLPLWIKGGQKDGITEHSSYASEAHCVPQLS